jgi:hypothetical protein
MRIRWSATSSQSSTPADARAARFVTQVAVPRPEPRRFQRRAARPADRSGVQPGWGSTSSASPFLGRTSARAFAAADNLVWGQAGTSSPPRTIPGAVGDVAIRRGTCRSVFIRGRRLSVRVFCRAGTASTSTTSYLRNDSRSVSFRKLTGYSRICAMAYVEHSRVVGGGGVADIVSDTRQPSPIRFGSEPDLNGATSCRPESWRAFPVGCRPARHLDRRLPHPPATRAGPPTHPGRLDPTSTTSCC